MAVIYDRADFIGKKFGMLTVEDLYIKPSKKGKRQNYVSCSCDCGSPKKCEYRATLVKMGRKTHCGCKKKRDLMGMKFSRWTVIGYTGYINKKNIWLVKCGCQNQTERSVDSRLLVNKMSKSCGCLRSESLFRVNFKGLDQFSGTAWEMIKRNGAKRNIDFNITLQEGLDLFDKQGGVCRYTGEQITLGTLAKYNRDRTASLDRIDSKKGYSVSNCEWVHKDINYMKWHLSKDAFLSLCFLCVNPLPISQTFNTQNVIESVKTRFNYELMRRNKGIVEFDEAYNLLVKQKFCCAITGLKLYFPQTYAAFSKGGTTASLDRIDSTKGYSMDNVQWVHKYINMMKLDYSMEEFISACNKIANYCLMSDE